MSLLKDEELRAWFIDDPTYEDHDPAWRDHSHWDVIGVCKAQQTKTLKAVAEWLVLVREEIDREHPSMDSPARYGLFVARITDALPLLTEGKMPGEEK